MSSANLVCPARWAVLRSLRELTRLAVTVLVLAVGLGGALAATAPPAQAQLRPSAVSSRVDTLRPEATPVTEGANEPTSPRPTSGVRTAAAATAVIADPQRTPAGEPGRGTPFRRGPPTR